MISEIVPRKAERQPTGSPKKKKKHMKLFVDALLELQIGR